MATPNDRGFNTIRNSRVDRRRKTETLQLYTLIGVVGLAVLTLILLVVMGVGGFVGSLNSDGSTPNNEKVDWGTFTVTPTDTLRGDLALVNNAHAYTFPSSDEHLAKIFDIWASHDPHPYMLSGLSTYMDRTALTALDAMLVDFAAATGRTNVQIRYAYRTYEEQQGLEIQPGHSDHHTGLGCALQYTGENKVAHDLTMDPVYNWLFENCHKYGFVIRYPDDKAAITGVSDYNYYFRYVGIPHATFMAAQGLCMEEYIELLKDFDNEKPLKIQAADGKAYEVYYVAVDGGATVKHPTNYAYTVSGTNEGGVVITVDRSRVLNPESDSAADTSAGTDQAQN